MRSLEKLLTHMKKEIEINQISSLGRTIISGKIIDEWKIFFKGKNDSEFISKSKGSIEISQKTLTFPVIKKLNSRKVVFFI